MMEKSKAEEKPYEPPRVLFHSKEEVLRMVGPAVGCARWSVLQGSLGGGGLPG